MHTHKHIKLPLNLITEHVLVYPTFHFFFQGETAVDSLQFRLHGQPPDVSLQVGSVHHADSKHDESDVLGLRSHQAALPLRVPAVLLLVLKHHSTSRVGRASNTYENAKEVLQGILQKFLGIPDLDLYLKPRITYLAHQTNSLGKLFGLRLYYSNNTATEPNPRHNGDNNE